MATQSETYRVADTYSDQLQQRAWDAEDQGSEVFVYWDDVYDVIRYIDIDGEEFENPYFAEEVEAAYWTGDAYRVAENYWRS